MSMIAELVKRLRKHADGIVKDYKEAADVIEELSVKLQAANMERSSQYYNGGWIPVSERLPEDHKDVLICLSSDQICIGSYNSHRLPFSNHAIGWGASYVHNWCSNDVIAWMDALPEPYRASPTGEEEQAE